MELQIENLNKNTGMNGRERSVYQKKVVKHNQ